MTDTKEKPLATIGAAGIVASDLNGDLFAEYAADRDYMLSLPFGQAKALARSGVAFTIVAMTEGEFPSLRDENVMEPCWLYACRAQAPYKVVDESSGEVKTFNTGDTFLLKLAKTGGLRTRDAETIRQLLKRDTRSGENAEVANVALQEYPQKTKGFSNPTGLVAASQWMPLAQLVAKRKGETA